MASSVSHLHDASVVQALVCQRPRQREQDLKILNNLSGSLEPVGALPQLWDLVRLNFYEWAIGSQTLDLCWVAQRSNGTQTLYKLHLAVLFTVHVQLLKLLL